MFMGRAKWVRRQEGDIGQQGNGVGLIWSDRRVGYGSVGNREVMAISMLGYTLR